MNLSEKKNKEVVENDEFKCFYQKYCAYDGQYDLNTEISDSTKLTEFLKENL